MGSCAIRCHVVRIVWLPALLEFPFMETIHQDPRLLAIAKAQPYPLVFATVSGAHLYGFPSPNSDVDLRGVHVLPAREALGLHHRRDTLETMADPASGLDLDL